VEGRASANRSRPFRESERFSQNYVQNLRRLRQDRDAEVRVDGQTWRCASESGHSIHGAGAIRLNSGEEYLLAMVREEMFLVRIQGERARRVLRVQTHASQRHNIRNWRNQNLATVIEADETTIE